MELFFVRELCLFCPTSIFLFESWCVSSSSNKINVQYLVFRGYILLIILKKVLFLALYFTDTSSSLFPTSVSHARVISFFEMVWNIPWRFPSVYFRVLSEEYLFHSSRGILD